MLTASNDHTARLTRISDSATLATVRHEKAIVDAALSTDNQLILTGSWDNTAKITTIQGDIRATISHSQPVSQVSLSADNCFALRLCWGQVAKITDTTTGRTIRTLTGIKTASFSPNSRFVLTTARERKVAQLIAIDSGQIVASIGHTKDVYYAAFSQDGQFVVTVSANSVKRTFLNPDGSQWG